jgi:hypothetical protein
VQPFSHYTAKEENIDSHSLVFGPRARHGSFEEFGISDNTLTIVFCAFGNMEQGVSHVP